ncbi:hypothetical protein MXB_3648 [Myxobolus squamalis]|nr:hypothetical protein MXB_3648 [Myxobolus squamalis]
MMLNHMPNIRNHKKSLKMNSSKLSLSECQIQECRLLMSCLEQTVLNLIFLEQLSNCIFFPIPGAQIHLVKVTELLITGTFFSDSTTEVVRELSIFLCIFSLEANLNNFTQSLCMILVSVRLVKLSLSYMKGDSFQSNLSNLYQSLIFTVINFISLVSKNLKLTDLCGRIRAARIAVNPSFWMPCELLEPATYSVINDLKPDVFFDQKNIEKAFNSNVLAATLESAVNDKNGPAVLLTESDYLSIDSEHSNNLAGI